MRNVYQNLFGAFVYNGLGLPIALGVLYPFIGLLLSPILAALAMSFSSVTVISNANRLKRFRLAGGCRMTPDQILVTARRARARRVRRLVLLVQADARGQGRRTVSDGYQEQMILVKGGYTPDTIRVAAGRPSDSLFRRDETAACSEQVVLPDFGKSAPLPTGTVVPIEFMPGDPGEHEFTCQMGMLRGRIIVEAA